MPLDPQVDAIRARRAAEGYTSLYAMSLAEARAADLASIRAAGGGPEPVAQVTDGHIDGPGGPLRVRIYRPAGAGPHPVLVYFFGGGWTLGTIDTGDAVC